MFFTLIFENSTGDRIDMNTAANQYMTSKMQSQAPQAVFLYPSSKKE